MTAVHPQPTPIPPLTPALTAHVTRKALKDALSVLERVIPARSSNPVLTSLKVACAPDGLTLIGTNLDLDLAYHLPAQVDHPQDFSVPAHLFGQVVRNLDGELVTLTLTGTQLSVQAGGSHFELQTGDLGVFPPLAFPEGADVTLDAAELARALTSVRHAASHENFQAVFRGIKLEHHAGFARLVASDGYRVALREFPTTGMGRNLILPARHADDLVRVLKSGPARFSYGEGQLSVASGPVRLNLKLLEGEYPDYERVMPKTMQVQFTANAADLREAVSRVAVLSDKKANHRVDWLVAEGKLHMCAEGEYGRAQDTLEVVQAGTVPALNVAVNARHLLDALTPIEGDVEVRLGGPTTPILLRTEASRYTALLVLLRV
ncbi:DNA polymerase III subunit beta [Deinococcus aluminii]|uniref:Beta sliding clamp n=1 Tax=Deinococcus aluminii TaxID=1656885 RepID=A0ABP9XGX9_9DEIO